MNKMPAGKPPQSALPVMDQSTRRKALAKALRKPKMKPNPSNLGSG